MPLLYFANNDRVLVEYQLPSLSATLAGNRYVHRETYTNLASNVVVTTNPLFSNGFWSNGYYVAGNKIIENEPNPHRAKDNDRLYTYNQGTAVLFTGNAGLYPSGYVMLSATRYSENDRVMPGFFELPSLSALPPMRPESGASAASIESIPYPVTNLDTTKYYTLVPLVNLKNSIFYNYCVPGPLASGQFSTGAFSTGIKVTTGNNISSPFKAKDNGLHYLYADGVPSAANGWYRGTYPGSVGGYFVNGARITSANVLSAVAPTTAADENNQAYYYSTTGLLLSANGYFSNGWFNKGTLTTNTTGVPAKANDNNKYYTYDNGNASLFTGYSLLGYSNQGVLSTRTAVATAVRPVLNNVHLDYRTLPPKPAVGLFAEGSLVEGAGRYLAGIKQTTLTAPVTSLTNNSRHYFVVNEEVKLAAGNSFGASKTLNVAEADYSSSASALSAMQVLSPLLSSNKDIAFLSNGVYSGGLKVTLPPGLAIAAYNDVTKALTTYRLGLATVTAAPKTPATAPTFVVAPSAAVFAAETTANGGDYSVKLVSGPIYHYANASRFGKPQEVLGY